jgi:hypothetical protein
MFAPLMKLGLGVPTTPVAAMSARPIVPADWFVQ